VASSRSDPRRTEDSVGLATDMKLVSLLLTGCLTRSAVYDTSITGVGYLPIVSFDLVNMSSGAGPSGTHESIRYACM
jgi:hypothetical protein